MMYILQVNDVDSFYKKWNFESDVDSDHENSIKRTGSLQNRPRQRPRYNETLVSTCSLDAPSAKVRANKKRQLSDSCVVMSNVREESSHGWLSPKPMQSRMRPLEISTSFSSSLSSTTEEDDRSETSGDSTNEIQSVTLVPESSPSASPSESVPSLTLSLSSSTYATPTPSPYFSPQSSFYSCRSSICCSSTNDLGTYKFYFDQAKDE